MTRYQDTVNWMFNQLPMYQHQGKKAYKVDLANTVLLAKHLDNPEKKIKSIHVAGTNGKGSTSHMLASVLQEAGYKVGLYTSPHLKDFRERIKINGNMIPEAAVVQFIQEHKPFFETHALSFFEMTVGMAFDYFSKEKVDIAIVEVGLGGRLDSTNIITPEVSVITNIGLDHTKFLGTSLEAIAKEKGGIIKSKVPVVIGETHIKTATVFNSLAQKNNADIYFADQFILNNFDTDLKGHYQQKNIKTVVQTLTVLRAIGYKVTDADVIAGLKCVVKHTGLKGRWQVLQKSPKIICDTAHNKEGLTFVMRQLLSQSFDTLHIVLGVVNDKDLNSIVELFPKNAIYYFCKPNMPRGLSANQLEAVFRANDCYGKVYNSVNEALSFAKQNATATDIIYVGGSTFVVAEII